MNTSTGAPKRPQFLTVLCILSFIGCGIGLVSGVMGYFSNKALASSGLQEAMTNAGGEMAEASAEMGQAMDMLGGMGLDFGKMATSSLIVGLLNIVVLLGVLMMWKLKKTGYYIYTLGQVASVATPFLVIGSLAGGLMATLGAIFPILFIILYGLNLKHMS
ncbi:MAG TPA: hypothetical protein VKG92_10775 [Flavobacteriales bacterium]|nr:hypothetical protein [Flavobacteriales bacterium]